MGSFLKVYTHILNENFSGDSIILATVLSLVGTD